MKAESDHEAGCFRRPLGNILPDEVGVPRHLLSPLNRQSEGDQGVAYFFVLIGP